MCVFALVIGIAQVAAGSAMLAQCGTSTTWCLTAQDCCHPPGGKPGGSYSGYGCMALSSHRVCCKPGPKDPPSEDLPNCLIIGDSVSLGYTAGVAYRLRGKCKVQHGPWSSGGGAENVRYGRECVDNWLVTQAQLPVAWDVILFNFGLHDNGLHDDQDLYRERLTNLTGRLQASGARLLYALTTPNMRQATASEPALVVERLNALAAQVMQRARPQQPGIVDLYSVVTAHCGAFYTDCDWCNEEPCHLHYKADGYHALANAVATAMEAELNISSTAAPSQPIKIVRAEDSEEVVGFGGGVALGAVAALAAVAILLAGLRVRGGRLVNAVPTLRARPYATQMSTTDTSTQELGASSVSGAPQGWELNDAAQLAAQHTAAESVVPT
jgi:hypothetical protein